MNFFNPINKEFQTAYTQYCTDGNIDSLKKLYILHEQKFSTKLKAFLNLGQNATYKELHKLEKQGLKIACENEDTHIIDFILNKKNTDGIHKIKSKQHFITDTFFESLENGHLTLAKKLVCFIKSDKYFLSFCDEAFDNLCRNGNLEAIKILLENKELGVDLDILNLPRSNFTEPCESFVAACESDHIDVVKYLLSSPNLSTHVNLYYIEDSFFASKNLTTYLICDLGLKKNHSIFKCLICEGNDNFVEYLFDKLEFNKKIENTLIDKSLTTKVRHKI